MSIHRIVRADGSVVWRVRWRDGGRGSGARSRRFDRKADAVAFEDELRRRRRLGELVGFAGAQETLNVARQLGHDARLTLTTYGHVMDELDEAPRLAC